MPSISRRSSSQKVCPLLLISSFTIIIFGSIFIYPQFLFTPTSTNSNLQIALPYSFQNQISHLQTQLGLLLEQLHNEHTELKAISKFSDQVLSIAVSFDKLADSLSGFYSNATVVGNETSNVDEDFSDPEEIETVGPLLGRVFNSAELRNYTSPKPNRQSGRKNFLGLEAVSPSIGLGCAGMASNIDRFMTYKIYGVCPDDWDLAQKLIASGCDPLPRRRCFSRTPPHYSKPLPLNSSLWTQPSDFNILWNHYKCRDYKCLISNETIDRRGFFKCSDCFDLSRRRWEVPGDHESVSAEFTIDEVLRLKPGKISIGLDFSPSTGTFAALMREKNVTVASATLNLGAPFNEVMALRGLLPLYISIGSRLPFFDNTLDIVHTTLFLDGWIGMELLQFVLFDWDRVLRPKGLLWVDRFFCKKEDMELYLDEFTKLGYRKLLWRVVPKTDKLGDELFFSAVLEKPIRG
ncbi:probable methyltransferase At1g29790 [Cornus florida]|uniref:probable methyltransferase At1g29790 n=1 Tax=Cornus florida TaxID=4283 RepID=UPI0028A01F24|nr:probable methyltransferase At1g29790 [Cornus florida]